MSKSDLRKLAEIFLTFFKIGSFTFGGGFAMIPLIEKEVIDRKGWVEKDEIVDVLAVAQTVPGAVAINSATFIGSKIFGKKGALAATAGVILPSLIIITVIAAFFAHFQDTEVVKAVFMGIRPAVVALIIVAAVNVGKSSVRDKLGVLITVVSSTLIVFFDVSAIIVIIGGALTGLLVYWRFPSKAKRILKKEGDKN